MKNKESTARCKNCFWHYHEYITDGEVCVNGDSDYCTEFTDDDFCCNQFEERTEEKE